MKKLIPLSHTFSVLLLLFYVLLLLAGCSKKPSVVTPNVPGEAHLTPASAVQIELTPEQEKAIGLMTTDVKEVSFPVKIALNAKVVGVPDLMAHIFTPAQGKTMDIFASLGQFINQGQTLALLKSDQIGQIESDLLQQNLQNEADIKQARVQIKFSEAAFLREQKLFTDRVSAKADLEAAQTQYQKDKETLKTLETKRTAMIHSFQERLSLYGVPAGTAARVVQTRHLYPYIYIKSPRSGFLISRNINSGELADPSKELFTLADLKKVWLVGNVYERDVSQVQLGQPVRITIDSLPGQIFTGRVSYLANILDPQTRTLDIRAEVPNPHFSLKPNMFAHMEILTRNKMVTAVPLSALQRMGDKVFAYVQVAPHHYEERLVDVGETENQKVEIKKGLRQGEKIVVRGTLALKGEALKNEGSTGN